MVTAAEACIVATFPVQLNGVCNTPFTLQLRVALVKLAEPKFFTATCTAWLPGVTGETGATMAETPASFAARENSYAPGSGVVALRGAPVISSVTAGVTATPILFRAGVVCLGCAKLTK